jgi:hypothetical protein
VFWSFSSSNCDLASIPLLLTLFELWSHNCAWIAVFQFDDDDSFESLRIAKPNHLNLELFSLCIRWIWVFCDEFLWILVMNWWIWETLWRWLILIAVVLVCYGGDWILLRWWLEREILLEIFDGDVSLSNWEKFCVIGDVASIYRPSVMLWTNSLVTPGPGLGIIRPWTIFGLRAFLQNWKLQGPICKNNKRTEEINLDKKD